MTTVSTAIDWRQVGERRLRIAVVGSGVSGLVAARYLARAHDVTILEAAHYIGGHTNTIDVARDGRTWAVDTGFIVFNDWTYPNFIRLLGELGVDSQPSDMGFSVRCDRTGLEYNGSSLNTIFAQRRNLLRPSFYRMLRDIVRFNREALELLEGDDHATTLGEYLDAGGFSRQFVEHYLVPMGAAIWSAQPERMYEFPARYFVRFFHNHGMLSIDERPTWRVVKGGSRTYVNALLDAFPGVVRCEAPVVSICRHDSHVDIRVRGESPERFDAVVIATHSDTALAMLGDDASETERDVLGAIPYQQNEAVLHTDASLMPRRRRAWAAWNYHVGDGGGRVALTYNMNILQTLASDTQFLVTLNRDEDIRESEVLRRITYHHPVFTPEGVAAQGRIDEISGARRTFYCGAYWGFGFHEDGVKSGLAVADKFGVAPEVLATDRPLVRQA